MIEIFRLYLFFGMVVHKVAWEVLKNRNPRKEKDIPHKQSFFIMLIKTIKVIFLGFLIIQTLFLPEILPITADPIQLRYIALLIYTVGLVIALVGRIQLGKNWANIEDYQVLEKQQLVKQGLYGFIRHPIYTGDLLLILGLELALNSWLVLLVIPIAVVIYRQARAEERILSNAFNGYSVYQKETRMFIPYIF